MYLMVKHSHMLLVVLSVAMLFIRYILLMVSSPLAKKKHFKIASHTVDILLLLSGIALIHIVGFVPFRAGSEWLTEKIIYILGYVALAFFTLFISNNDSVAKNKPLKTVTFFGALGCVVVIVKIAITKTPILLG